MICVYFVDNWGESWFIVLIVQYLVGYAGIYNWNTWNSSKESSGLYL